MLPAALHPRWLEWARSFVLHVLTGVLAVLAHYAVMWLLLQAGSPRLAASGIGFLCGAVVRWLLSYYKVFAPSAGVPVTLARFGVALGAQLAANLLLLELLVGAGLALWWAQLATTVLLTFGNFLAYRLWVFR